MYKAVMRDPGFIVLMLGVTLFCIVSSPATYSAVEPFHHNNWVFAAAYFAALEFGAIACKLLTVALPSFKGRLSLMTFFLLFVTSVSNYITGRDLFLSADLGPTFEAIKDAGWGGLATIVYAGTIPALLYVFLSMAAQRAEDLTRSYRQSETNKAVAPIREAVLTFREIRAALAGIDTVDVQPDLPQLANSSSLPNDKITERLSTRRNISSINSRHRRRAAVFSQKSARRTAVGVITQWVNGIMHPATAVHSNGLEQLSNEDLERLYADWSGFCPVCGLSADPTLDHIVPLSKGGTHSKGNVRLVCASCNSAKRDKTETVDGALPLKVQIASLLLDSPDGLTMSWIRSKLNRDTSGDSHLRSTLKGMHERREIIAVRGGDGRSIVFKLAPIENIENGTSHDEEGLEVQKGS